MLRDPLQRVPIPPFHTLFFFWQGAAFWFAPPLLRGKGGSGTAAFAKTENKNGTHSLTTCVPRFLFSERGFQRLIDFEHIREDDLCTAPGNGKDFAGVFSDIRNDTVVQTDGF